MDVEQTIEFLLQHQARMAAENELFHAHQAEVRAEHEKHFEKLEVSQLELSGSLGQISKRIDSLAGLLSDSVENQERVGKANREQEARYKEERQELHKQMDERLNALIQIADEIIRQRPKQ